MPKILLTIDLSQGLISFTVHQFWSRVQGLIAFTCCTARGSKYRHFYRIQSLKITIHLSQLSNKERIKWRKGNYLSHVMCVIYKRVLAMGWWRESTTVSSAWRWFLATRRIPEVLALLRQPPSTTWRPRGGTPASTGPASCTTSTYSGLGPFPGPDQRRTRGKSYRG